MALQADLGRTLIHPPWHIPAGAWMARKHVPRRRYRYRDSLQWLQTPRERDS